MAELLGPAQQIAPIRSITDLDTFLGAGDVQVTGDLQRDGVFAEVRTFPTARNLFGGAIDPTHVACLVARRKTTLLAIYSTPDACLDLHGVAERFVDWDAAFQAWLVEHFMIVRRTIGIDKTVRALDGFPTVALTARMTWPLFPELWSVRVEMTQAWSREGGYPPGDTRNAHDLTAK